MLLSQSKSIMLGKITFSLYFYTVALVSQYHIISILTIVSIFFLILLILGIRKSHKLKKENDRLNKISALSVEESNKAYRDFTEGHLYE